MERVIIWLAFIGFFNILSCSYSWRPFEITFSLLTKLAGTNFARTIIPTTAFDSVLEKTGAIPLTRSPWGEDLTNRESVPSFKVVVRTSLPGLLKPLRSIRWSWAIVLCSSLFEKTDREARWYSFCLSLMNFSRPSFLESNI